MDGSAVVLLEVDRPLAHVRFPDIMRGGLAEVSNADVVVVFNRHLREARTLKNRHGREGEAHYIRPEPHAESPTPAQDAVARLESFAQREAAHVSIVFAAGQWSVALTWGKEAEDSPMAGAQALGADESLRKTLDDALAEARA